MRKTIDTLAKDLNIPSDKVLKVYKSYWKCIKAMIEELPLKEDLNEESFNACKKNFNIARLGKLYCDNKRYRRLKENDKYKKDKTDSELHSGN